MPLLLDQLRATGDRLTANDARIEISVSPPFADQFAQRLADTILRAGSAIDTVVGEQSAFAGTISVNDEITWWSDDEGFLTGRVTEIQRLEGEGRAFRVEGYEELVAEDDLYLPLTEHDALLWGVAPGDEVEWYCPPESVRRKYNPQPAPHCPGLSGAGCPGETWHRGRVEQVFHAGFDVPAFQVEGCSEKVREPLFEIRVPPKPG